MLNVHTPQLAGPRGQHPGPPRLYLPHAAVAPVFMTEVEFHLHSKRITDLKAKHNTIKPLENSTAENLDELKYGNDFLDIPPKP